MRKLIYLCCLVVGLSACSSKNISPLYQSAPIVNIESNIANAIAITPADKQIAVKNLTNNSIKTAYLLTWYDRNGVTQRTNWQQNELWQHLILPAKQQVNIPLSKPTDQSVNYRVYFKAY